MIISTEHIKSLKPCNDRLKNYLAHHESFSGTIQEFLSLGNIPHKDKLWVTFRSLDKKQSVECVCRFAESVLSIYENKYPGDLRPRKAIEAARTGENLKQSRDAAYAAATDADAAAYAAYAAAYAAYAAYAAAYAAPAAYAAAYAAAYPAYARTNMEKLQIQIIIDVVESK